LNGEIIRDEITAGGAGITGRNQPGPHLLLDEEVPLVHFAVLKEMIA
jgi:hypothetical protein